MKTDIHNHAVPERVVEFFEREPAFGLTVSGDRHLSGGPEGEYELEPAFYDAESKVANLEERGLEAAIISVDPPFFYYDVDPGIGADLATLINEGSATERRAPGPPALDGDRAAAGPGAGRSGAA